MMYSTRYDSSEIRNNGYSVIKHIAPFVSSSDFVLDFGCGTCKKTLDLAALTKSVIGIDCNATMISKAEDNIVRSNCTNITVLEADNTASPFSSEQFDLCTAFLTTFSPAEAHRVLKHDGRFIIEMVTADDKIQFKRKFGTDQFGWRGRFLNQTREERNNYILASLSPFFEVEKLIPVEFETTLTFSGATQMLQETPTIRNFDIDEDAHVLTRMAKNGKVSFFEKRLIIIAKKITLNELAFPSNK